MAWNAKKSEGGRGRSRGKNQERRNSNGGKKEEGSSFGGKRFPSKYGKKSTRGYAPNGGKIKLTAKNEYKEDDGTIRLNRYIAKAGICSRREADTLIASGAIKVNGKVVTELGTKVAKGDKVQYEDQTLKNEQLVYYILNKPKDYITTMDDPQKRKTVLDLLRGACKERIYPVGRLDRNTSGVLLFTNDGDLSKKLLHPKHLVKKIYQATLDKSLKQEDFNKIKEGLQLEDGFIQPDELAYSSKENKKEIGIEIHSGKNRIVRRIFEALGYRVIRLDRVYFAGLTKKSLSRGQYRKLSEDEVRHLKMLG